MLKIVNETIKKTTNPYTIKPRLELVHYIYKK